MRHEFWIPVAAATLLSVAALAQGTPGGAGAPGGIGGPGGSAVGGAASPGRSGGSGGTGTTPSPSPAPTPGGVGTSTPGGVGTSGPSTAGPAVGGTGSASGASGGVSLTAAQHTQVMRAFTSVKPLTGISFAIGIGAIIPATVELHQVPAEVVQVVPAYSGYSYFVVGNQIVIVEPRARRIVAVLQRTG
jgi:hypothetical protein